MSTKQNNFPGFTSLVGIISLHLFLIFRSVFFLSPEFSIYPYFLSQKLIPYLQIIDQHFPMVLFGPINLNVFNLFSPQGNLLLFIGLLILTDLFAWISLLRSKLTQTQKSIAMLAFLCFELLFNGQTLWLENFVVVFTVAGLAVNHKTIRGLLWGFAVSIRPNLLPLFLVFWWFDGKSVSQLISILFPFFWEIAWVYQNHLFSAFKDLVITFNATVYTIQAKLLPNTREILLIAIMMALGLIASQNITQTIIWFVVFCMALIGIIPRFDMSHVLPLTAVWIWWVRQNSRRFNLIGVVVVIILIAIIIKKYPYKSVNFYYPPQLYEISQIIDKKYSGKNIYFLGGPDQLYVLTHSMPPGNYYLPSLPWYLSQDTFVNKEMEILKQNKDYLVSINQDSKVDGKNLVDYSQPLQRLISSEYFSVDQIGPLVIYKHI